MERWGRGLGCLGKYGEDSVDVIQDFSKDEAASLRATY